MKKIFQAALENDTLAVKEYLKFGDVNITDKYNSSLLHYAARGNALEVANLLLDNYINLNIVNDKGETPLFEAISRGELGFCKLLCRYHADSNIVNNFGETVYFKAIIKGECEILELIEDFLEINYLFVNSNGENALFYALKAYNNALFLRLANDYPQLLNQRNHANINLLMLALKYDNEEICNYLLDKFDNYYECDYFNNNVIFYAARYTSIDIMRKILAKKVIIEGKNKDDETIFDLANLNPHLSLMIIENYYESYEYRLYKKTYPFHVAVIKRDYDLLEYCNVELNKKDTNGVSLLNYIEMVNDIEIYKIFKLKTKSQPY